MHASWSGCVRHTPARIKFNAKSCLFPTSITKSNCMHQQSHRKYHPFRPLILVHSPSSFPRSHPLPASTRRFTTPSCPPHSYRSLLPQHSHEPFVRSVRFPDYLNADREFLLVGDDLLQQHSSSRVHDVIPLPLGDVEDVPPPCPQQCHQLCRPTSTLSTIHLTSQELNSAGAPWSPPPSTPSTCVEASLPTPPMAPLPSYSSPALAADRKSVV